MGIEWVVVSDSLKDGIKLRELLSHGGVYVIKQWSNGWYKAYIEMKEIDGYATMDHKMLSEVYLTFEAAEAFKTQYD